MNRDVERILFSEEEIKKAVARIGAQITRDYEGKKPLLVGILKGSVVFMADIMRAVELNCDIDFMDAKSYGNQAVSSGNVKIIKDLDTDITGRDIIIIEDILDSARTLHAVCQYLKNKNPSSIKLCTLLDKKVERAVDITVDYKCFDIENEFVIGYGLDYAENYRNLPYVGVLKREVYEK
ncbi:MAG: hypoxanthine phosphoribosyltransferase [Ruminiclostridium sp.]|nr:hypoxanthine phosphoribosyltransferase [Ruminiclostridium sp.]MBQ8841850.1 hypoxanthine phosphoribosyltransferase [Ruminiclostridium sp.]